MGAANVINSGYGSVLRTAGWQQTDTGLLWIPPSMQIFSPPNSLGNASATAFREGIWIRRFELQNLNAGTINVGIGSRMANLHWGGGLLSSDGVTFTDLTSALQSTASTAVQVTGADQTGSVIFADRKFDWMSFNVTTAETDGGGAVPDHVLQYSTAAGWTTIVAAMVLTDTLTTSNAVWTAIVRNLVWEKQPDWVVTNSAVHGGVPAGKYAIRLNSTDREAGDTAAKVSGVEIGEALLLKSLTTTGIWEMEEVDYWMPAGDGLVAYFSDATLSNRVYAEVLSR